jgi:hypothetical protein
VRLEHLITAVRTCMLEVLIDELGFARSRARLMAGITDMSNFRRQLRRARDAGEWPRHMSG